MFCTYILAPDMTKKENNYNQLITSMVAWASKHNQSQVFIREENKQ